MGGGASAEVGGASNTTQHLSSQVGDGLIQDFLDKARSLPVSTMTDEEVKAELRRMKQELVAEGNAYVGDILARCGGTA